MGVKFQAGRKLHDRINFPALLLLLYAVEWVQTAGSMATFYIGYAREVCRSYPPGERDRTKRGSVRRAHSA
jgi:hypothetical protein